MIEEEVAELQAKVSRSQDKEAELEEIINTLRTRIEDVENASLAEQTIIKLVPSDDIELVKARLNELIDLVNGGKS